MIQKLTDEKATHIPYRDSKLTRLLQSSLAGNSKISVLCTISTHVDNKEETLSTLKFAARVKKVPIRPLKNTTLDEGALIQQYQHEIYSLKQQLLDTNLKLEKERNSHDVSHLIAERQRFEEKLHQSHLVRLALKERIEHLTKMILTSDTSTPSLLDWNAPADPTVPLLKI